MRRKSPTRGSVAEPCNPPGRPGRGEHGTRESGQDGEDQHRLGQAVIENRDSFGQDSVRIEDRPQAGKDEERHGDREDHHRGCRQDARRLGRRCAGDLSPDRPSEEEAAARQDHGDDQQRRDDEERGGAVGTAGDQLEPFADQAGAALDDSRYLHRDARPQKRAEDARPVGKQRRGELLAEPVVDGREQLARPNGEDVRLLDDAGQAGEYRPQSLALRHDDRRLGRRRGGRGPQRLLLRLGIGDLRLQLPLEGVCAGEHRLDLPLELRQRCRVEVGALQRGVDLVEGRVPSVELDLARILRQRRAKDQRDGDKDARKADESEKHRAPACDGIQTRASPAGCRLLEPGNRTVSRKKDCLRLPLSRHYFSPGSGPGQTRDGESPGGDNMRPWQRLLQAVRGSVSFLPETADSGRKSQFHSKSQNQEIAMAIDPRRFCSP